MIKNRKKIKGLAGLAAIFIMAFLFLPNLSIIAQEEIISEELDSETILELNKKISAKRNEIEKLEDARKTYDQKINTLISQEKNLNNQLAFMENLIAKTEIDIRLIEGKIAETVYKIREIKLQIEAKEKEITEQRDYLEMLLKLIYRYNEKSYLEVLLAHDSISAFLEEVNYLKKIQNDLSKVLNRVATLKNNLIEKESELDLKKKDLKEQKAGLVVKQDSLHEEKLLKTTLLEETRASEKSFQSLYAELKQEQAQVESDIAVLEKKMREKLESQENSLAALGDVSFSWPISPDRGMSAFFHDPDYPFRYIFEHPGIDIRAYQGSEVKAAETGYVGVAKNAGMGYSYIMLVHNEGFSTVYGHVSRIDVSEGDYVTKGQVIGLSGGMPGTRGAGRLTTGPHLHFEIRYNGIPVNPLNYLP